MTLENFIRKLVKQDVSLKYKLKRADSKLSSFQYVYQTLSMTIFSFIGIAVILFLISKKDLNKFIIMFSVLILSTPLIYKFWYNVILVQINKLGREIENDLLFILEYLLVSLESGLPIGNAIENLSKINRPGAHFFKRIYTEFKTGKSFKESLAEGVDFAPSKSVKQLIKKIKDSTEVGVDLEGVLVNFIKESSDQKLLAIKSFSKKLNPIIMMYLLLGIVLPSLGVTFFILAASLLEMTPSMLRIVLVFIFLGMFAFQYFAYSIFKFNRSIL